MNRQTDLKAATPHRGSLLPLLTVLASLAMAAPASLFADDTSERPVFRVVFFTPSDVEPPDGVRERLKEHVEYSQMFYGKWMKHWGYESEKPLAVNRDKDGFPEILYVKGRHTEESGRYRQLGFQPEVIETACRQYKIDPAGQVWWIFTYKGPQNRGFRGGGNAKRGGTSTSIYDPSAEGTLRLTDQLGSDTVRKNSKASIHELGHAFGLPHIGPLRNDELGNSLMGPVVKAYRSRHPNEPRVYLTKASAAMLWKHPLFSGTTKDRELTPKLRFENFHVTYDKDQAKMIVSGKLVSDIGAHTIVVANDSDATRSDYWRKCFAEKIAEDGTFQVTIDELDKTNGQLRIVCCFDNGAVVGRNEGLGLQSGFAKQYRFSDGGFTFEEGWAVPKAGRRQGPARRPNPARLRVPAE